MEPKEGKVENHESIQNGTNEKRKEEGEETWELWYGMDGSKAMRFRRKHVLATMCVQ